ncbi:MAG: PAS domain S-box protein [bacterium]|nr:PAS domain S-box protein [bacterium]
MHRFGPIVRTRDLVLIVNAKGHVVDASQEALRLLNLPTTNSNVVWWKNLPLSQQDLVEQHWKCLVGSGEEFAIPFAPPEDQPQAPVTACFSPRKSHSRPEFLVSLVIVQDETGNYPLRENTSLSAFWIVDLQSEKVSLDPYWGTVFGFDSKDLPKCREDFLKFIHPEDLAQVKNALELVRSGISRYYWACYRLRNSDGEYLRCLDWGIISRNGAKDQGGSQLVGLNTRIMDEELVNQSLPENPIYLLEHLQESLVATDLEGRIKYWSKASEKLYGWKAAEVLGEHVSLIVAQDDAEEENLRIQSVLEKGFWKGSYRQLRKDGKSFLSGTYISLVRDRNGKPIGLVGIDHDITERVETENTLADLKNELSNLAGLRFRAELLAGISHDINQPLYAIQNFAFAAAKHFERGDLQKCEYLIHRISDEVEKANDISDRLRQYARKAQVFKSHVSFKELVQKIYPLARIYAEDANAKISFRLNAFPDTVFCDQLQIQQVLLNLIKNASESLRSKPPSDIPRIEVYSHAESNRFTFGVIDNGLGVEPVDASRIFDHFYTTKLDGIGIGLPLCKSIMEAHGGSLHLDLETGEAKGAKLVATLPL